MDLYAQITNPALLVRRINLTASNLARESDALQDLAPEQLDLFGDHQLLAQERADQERERRQQKAILSIKKKFGKNAILRGTNLMDGATAMDRNRQIGGHKA